MHLASSREGQKVSLTPLSPPPPSLPSHPPTHRPTHPPPRGSLLALPYLPRPAKPRFLLCPVTCCSTKRGEDAQGWTTKQVHQNHVELRTTSQLEGEVRGLWLAHSSLHICLVCSRLISARTRPCTRCSTNQSPNSPNDASRHTRPRRRPFPLVFGTHIPKARCLLVALSGGHLQRHLHADRAAWEQTEQQTLLKRHDKTVSTVAGGGLGTRQLSTRPRRGHQKRQGPEASPRKVPKQIRDEVSGAHDRDEFPQNKTNGFPATQCHEVLLCCSLRGVRIFMVRKRVHRYVQSMRHLRSPFRARGSNATHFENKPEAFSQWSARV